MALVPSRKITLTGYWLESAGLESPEEGLKSADEGLESGNEGLKSSDVCSKSTDVGLASADACFLSSDEGLESFGVIFGSEDSFGLFLAVSVVCVFDAQVALMACLSSNPFSPKDDWQTIRIRFS